MAHQRFPQRFLGTFSCFSPQFISYYRIQRQFILPTGAQTEANTFFTKSIKFPPLLTVQPQVVQPSPSSLYPLITFNPTTLSEQVG